MDLVVFAEGGVHEAPGERWWGERFCGWGAPQNASFCSICWELLAVGLPAPASSAGNVPECPVLAGGEFLWTAPENAPFCTVADESKSFVETQARGIDRRLRGGNHWQRRCMPLGRKGRSLDRERKGDKPPSDLVV